MKAPERSTVGVEITFRDANGALILVGAMTAFRLEVHGSKPGIANPLITITTLPTSNPQIYPLNLSTLDRDATGDRLRVEFKLTYDSTTLGNGAIARSEEPFEIHLVNSRIAT